LKTLLEYFFFLGGGLCHQRIERTFKIDSLNMPVCSRCTGIYLGIFLSLITIILLERKIKGKLPSLKIMLVSVGTILIMGADVTLSAMGIIESSNIIRFITGFTAGWFIALLLFSIANNAMFKKLVKRNYLDNYKKFIIWIVAGIALATLYIFTYQYIIVLWAAVAVLGLIAFVTFILFILFFSFNKKLAGSIDSWGKYLAAIAAGTVSSIMLLSLFSLVRRFLI